MKLLEIRPGNVRFPKTILIIQNFRFKDSDLEVAQCAWSCDNSAKLVYIRTKHRGRNVTVTDSYSGGHGFPYCLQPNARIVPQIWLRLIPSKSFPIHHSITGHSTPHNLELLQASLNKQKINK